MDDLPPPDLEHHRGRPRGSRGAAKIYRVCLKRRLTVELESAAAWRELDPETLINRIVRIVIDAKLIDAVLDDAK